MKHTKKSTINYLGIKKGKPQQKQFSHHGNENGTLDYLNIRKRKTAI